MKGNNVTYTGKSWRKKTYWEELDQDIPESPTFLHRPARQYQSDYSHGNYSYLPYNNHYYGMDKIKGGKGYKKDGTPIGIIKGKCKECDGTVISVTMNTSSKGFETSNEKVCDTCGLVVAGPYQVLDIEEQIYHTKPTTSHEEWVEIAKMSEQRDFEYFTDVAWDTEIYEHINGTRMSGDTGMAVDILHNGASGEVCLDAPSRNQYKNDLARDLKLNNWKSEHWGRGTEERMKHKHMQQMDYLDICKTMLGMHRGQVEEVKYILDTYGTKHFHRQASYEDIILCICLVVMSRYVNNGYMATIKRQLPMYDKDMKALYQRVKEIMP